MNRLIYDIAKKTRQEAASLLKNSPGDSRVIGPPRGLILSTYDWYQSLSQSQKDLHRYHKIFPSSELKRPLPELADPPIKELFSQMMDGVIKEGFVAEIHRGRYWGRWYGYIISDDDELFFDLSPSPIDRGSFHIDTSIHDAFCRVKIPRMKYLDKTIATINTLFCSNFHHWLIDTLPKIGLMLEAGIDLASIDYFIFDYKNTPYQNEALEKLNIPLEKVLPSHKGMHIQAKNLIVPSYAEPGGLPEIYSYTPQGIKFVRQLFLTADNSTGGAGKRVLVSRRKAKVRRLTCEDEVLDVLQQKYGFTSVALEDFSVTEQAQIFHNADIVIFPHGGGLANCFFCREGAKIVEVFMPKYLPTFMMPLSHDLGLKYYALVGDPSDDDDIHINPSRIIDLIQEIIDA
jgi:Glycosyltransferase 61